MKQKGFNLNECAADSEGEKTGMERRVLRSGPAANSENHHGAVEKKRKGARKGDLSNGTHELPVSKETQGGDFIAQIIMEYKDDISDDENGKELKVKRKRGRPRKLQVSIQSDDYEESYFDKEKTLVKLEDGQSAEADFRSLVKIETNDGRSYDANGNVETHDDDPKVKRKRGRPRKLQISRPPDESGSNTNCKFATTPDLISSLSNVDRLSLKRQHGRPPKTKETAVVPYTRKEGVNYRHGSTVITQDQSMSDSIDESRRPKSNYGGNCRGRKMVRKRGRPPTPHKERKSGGTDETGYKAKKRLKPCESPLESRHDNVLIDGERGIGERQDKQIETGNQSKTQSKKMLSDRILQLLLAAGWTVEYRPRNGRPSYSDAVYLNSEGKTHWSITKAYNVYKDQLESSMDDQMNSTTGPGFGLLSEEDLHLLGRTIQKKRCDSGKQRSKWKDEDTNENRVSTKGKKVQKGNIRLQKLIRASQGKKKLKGSHGSHSLEKFSVSVRKIKREEKHNRKPCALSARSSLDDADSMVNGYILFEGKRTTLGWMIDSAIVSLKGKVKCMNCEKTQVLLEGIFTKEGVRCNCCDEVFSVLDFQVHAGGKHNQPFRSLYLEDGNSLLQSLLEFWNKQSESQLKGFHFVDFGGGDPNDDTCGICGDGGNLICCDGCPSTFHQSCLDIENFPSGAWFCCYCSCKYCEKFEEANHDTVTLPLSSCCLCEEKYHQACIKQDDKVSGERSTRSFCGKDCLELFEGLQLLIGVKHPLPEGFSWTFLRRFELPREVSDSDISEKIAHNAKLAVAFSVMDECFSPLVDHRSGVNLLQNIVYNFGSNFHRLNYSSFLTAVLERGDEIIAVASIRIHGNRLAEMPFIGTRYMYRRHGMCRRLMSGIESALGSLKVDKLVIPAVPELMDTWTSGFSFRPVHESAKKTIKNLNLLVFPGVDMLEKSLAKEKMAESNVSSSNGDLPLAPEMSLPVNVEENKPEVSKDSTHERNCATADVEVGDNDSEEKEEIGKVTDKDDDFLPDVVDDCIGYSQRESNSRVADDSHADQTNTERQESGDLEDNTQLSDGGCGGKAEESDQQSDCYILDHFQPLGIGGTGEEMDNKTLVVKREVTSTLRTSSRLRSWRTSRVKQKYTGRNAVLLDSPQRYV